MEEKGSADHHETAWMNEGRERPFPFHFLDWITIWIKRRNFCCIIRELKRGLHPIIIIIIWKNERKKSRSSQTVIQKIRREKVKDDMRSGWGDDHKTRGSSGKRRAEDSIHMRDSETFRRTWQPWVEYHMGYVMWMCHIQWMNQTIDDDAQEWIPEGPKCRTREKRGEEETQVIPSHHFSPASILFLQFTSPHLLISIPLLSIHAPSSHPCYTPFTLVRFEGKERNGETFFFSLLLSHSWPLNGLTQGFMAWNTNYWIRCWNSHEDLLHIMMTRICESSFDLKQSTNPLLIK